MKKYSVIIQQKVLRGCQNLASSSRLFKNAQEGKFTKNHVSIYLANLEFLFRENCKDIFKASQLSQEKALCDFFKLKWKEENGHDQWAKNDLKKMRIHTEFNEPYILNEMKNLTNFLHKTMLHSPYSYITYMYYAEYMTASLGPIWFNLLKKNLGIQSENLTALTKHIELDGDHASEVCQFMDSLNLPVDIIDECEKFCDDLISMYNNFFNELADLNEICTKQSDNNHLSERTSSPI